MKRLLPQKITAFLLTVIFAFNFSLGVIPVPAAAAVTPVIEDLSYQKINSATVNDLKTDLRLVFTINTTSLNSVGFVISLSDSNPEIGKITCYTKSVGKVYSSITADGMTVNAPSGKYFVAVKLSEIPHASFDAPIHLRAYAEDTAGNITYSEAKTLTVCEALGHKHTVPSPSSTVSATVVSSGTKTGTCSVCNLPGVTEYTEKTTPVIFNGKDSSAPSGWGYGANFFPDRIYLQTFASSNGYFYPTDEHPEGQDLLVEFSLLWNNTLNLGTSSNNIVIGRIDTKGGNPKATPTWLHLGTGDHCCPHVGGFELGDIGTVLYGPDSADNATAEHYSFIGDYGWHRIGVRWHQDAEIVSGSVSYKLTYTVYVDGLEVNKVQVADSVISNNVLLYTASISDGHLVYSNISDGNKTLSWLRAENFFGSSSNKILALADYSVTAGQNFVQSVMPAENNVGATLATGGTPLPATEYYQVTKVSDCDHEYNENWFIGTTPTATKNGTKVFVCKKCGEAKNTLYSYADYNAELASVKSALSSFKSSDMGTALTSSAKSMSTTAYNAPTAMTTAGQHPRVLFTADDVPAIRAQLFNPDNASKLDSLINAANEYTSGKLPSATVHTSSPKGKHNYDSDLLSCCSANALLYQLTGSPIYGYKAIQMMKEFISTLSITTSGSDKVNDSCRYYGETMYTAACVYDWCYDLLTSTDKDDLLRGVVRKIVAGSNMEVGYPPSDQGAVTGHGSERQILRDYLSFAIAIYDEEPTWYKYVGGRVYQEYVPVRNAYYQGTYAPQGLSNYLNIRFTSDLWSALLLQAATGANPYDAENMKEVMHSVYARNISGTAEMFSEGDNELKSGAELLRSFALPGLMSAYLFGDSMAATWAEDRDYSYTSAYLYFIFRSNEDGQPAASKFTDLDLIRYNAGYIQTLVAQNTRNNPGGISDWTTAAVYMKIGGSMTANHDHADAGSFQIFYREMIAPDTGVYDSYGSNHHKYFHQATIAHNSIVFYKSGSATPVGQNQPGETKILSDLSSAPYKTGTLTGVSYGYTDTTKTQTKYAYIAGDIADAYSNANVATEVTRRMLAVFDTNTNNIPLFFFVYDNITTKDTTTKKTFLLQCKYEPVIDGNKVIIDGGSGSSKGGRLVLINAFGGDNITTVQGYKVGSNTYTPSYSKSETYWGRLEISPNTGNKTDRMLNVMFATQQNRGYSTSIETYSNKTVHVAVANDKAAAVFVSDAARATTTFAFYAPGTGDLDYYVSGVAAGAWDVVDQSENTLMTVTATEEGGFLSFTAPAGTIKLRPHT